MTTRAVHWHDGMFLRPHHYQAAARYQQHVANRNEKWDVHFNWGLRSIEIDLDALANFRFAVGSLKARLPDGTPVALPEDGVLPALDLKPAFDEQQRVTIFLAVPMLHLGKANVAAGTSADGVRYLLQTQELEDENTGVNPQRVHVRVLNLKLLLSTQDQSGYEVLPIARIEKSPRAEASPQLDRTYIPPLLACDAWEPFLADILHALADRIGKKIEVLSNQVVSRGITFDSHAQGDPLIFTQLRELNEAYPVMKLLAFTQGIHPLGAYFELCRLVGKLAIFDAPRRPPDLPLYDHDDLGGCFFEVKRYLDALLEKAIEPEYKERPFMGAGLRMQVPLEPAWLEAQWEMYVGVQSSLEPAELIRLLTESGQLDMKIGSSDRVDTIFRQGQAGLRFEPCVKPPRVLPELTGLLYFQISREYAPLEWQNVQKSLTLALRLNEKRIAGNIQGQRFLAIKMGTQTTNLQFTLYVVPQT